MQNSSDTRFIKYRAYQILDFLERFVTGEVRNHKGSEPERFRTRKVRNQKVQNQKGSEPERFRTRKVRNQKGSELERLGTIMIWNQEDLESEKFDIC